MKFGAWCNKITGINRIMQEIMGIITSALEFGASALAIGSTWTICTALNCNDVTAT